VLHELEKIVYDRDATAGKDYQFNVMDHAADIAGTDGLKFADMVHAAFSAPDAGYGNAKEAGRQLSSGGTSPTGQFLEGIYARTDYKTSDFNPLIVDRDDRNTVTHHFGEFLKIGARGENVPVLDQWDIVTNQDDPEENPGDVRNGFFGVMLGNGLKDGTITPQQAADLTRWAFSGDSGGAGAPPWGRTADDAKNDDNNFKETGWGPWKDKEFQGYLNQDRYTNIQDWVNAYNAAHA
jgi:hypothetical protein